MTSDDLPGFHEAFRSLQRVFPLRGEQADLDRMVADYFRLLRRFAVQDVKAGADAWLLHGTKFPKPAEWIGAIPRRPGAAELRQMTRQEAFDHRRADRIGYQDEPCACADCVAAGVSEKALRFVPEFDDDDRTILAFNPFSQKPEPVGHWAHGRELARWYEAKADFYNAFIARFGTEPSKLLTQVGQEAVRPAVVKARMRRLMEAS